MRVELDRKGWEKQKKKGSGNVQSAQKEYCCEGDLLPYGEAEAPYRDHGEH